MIVNLPSTSRSRAAVARRAHNPKVGSSSLPLASLKQNMNKEKRVFTLFFSFLKAKLNSSSSIKLFVVFFIFLFLKTLGILFFLTLNFMTSFLPSELTSTFIFSSKLNFMSPSPRRKIFPLPSTVTLLSFFLLVTISEFLELKELPKEGLEKDKN